MAAESNKSSSRSADSFIGSFISLVSKSDIRYEGSLFHLNAQKSTIGLRDVKSFGTEGRRKDGPQVLSSDIVYEYIFFRGNDIKDLQVTSSPPVQSTPALPNDPAIIRYHYPHSISASSSFPYTSAVPATNCSSNAQLGLPNSTFPGNLPQNQPVGSFGSWGSFPPPPANGNGIDVPTYWPQQSGSFVGVSHLQQQILLQTQQSLPVSPLMQQQKQNPTVKASLPGDASHFAESSRPLLSTVYTGLPNTASNVPPPSDLPSSVPIRQSATLPSKLSPNLMPDNSFNALPTLTLGSHSPLVSPFTASSLDGNPVVPPIMEVQQDGNPVSVAYQTKSQSMPSTVGSFSPVHGETSIPSLLTPGQLLQPGSTEHSSSHMQTAPAHKEIDTVHGEASISCLLTSDRLMQPGSTGHSLSHLQTAHKEIVAIQSSSSESMSSDSENAMDLAEKLPSTSAEKLNGASLHTHHSNKHPGQRKGKTLTGTAVCANHSKRNQARERGNWPNQAATCSHRIHRGNTRRRASMANGAPFHPCKSNRGHSRGRENGPNKKDAIYTRHSDGSCGWQEELRVILALLKFLWTSAIQIAHGLSWSSLLRPEWLVGFVGRQRKDRKRSVHLLKYNIHFSWHTLNLRGKILTFPFFSTNTLIQTQLEGIKVSVTMLKPACLNVSPTTTKFTEDFDFEAMNEKFNKAKIWGHLGKTNKSILQDKKGHEKANDANDVEDDDFDKDGLPKFDAKPVYVKDDFFDSISCNSLYRGSGRGRAKFSEQRKIDIETFGEIPRQRRGRSCWGRPGRGGQSRGSHRGRGYGYAGRGRELTVWSRVT
ncbi:protein decapping 5-like [Actinidia eriantha]|uniref:protein decapping 5-like n=1 Tax=Actinidia eriantha TaxID=165200 RepID=UPI002587D6AB|nr:protein decapping 5-like [Actinidia eriantha]